MYLLLPLFKTHGRNVRFDPDGFYTYEHISLGSDVFLGMAPMLMSAEANIQIGSKVMFGPHVTIITGNHNVRQVGMAMADVQVKTEADDQDVVIEDDVWVGSRAIILKGVRVGRGSIVGAGAIVTADVPPYSIVVGAPARTLRFRWDIDTIRRHEELLYPESKRMSVAQLLKCRASFEQFQACSSYLPCQHGDSKVSSRPD